MYIQMYIISDMFALAYIMFVNDPWSLFLYFNVQQIYAYQNA